MFTDRNVFSSSFTSSAPSVLETTITRSTICPYSPRASSAHRAVMPPTTFGVFLMPHVGFPGSTRSGLNARKKSSPTCRSVLALSAGSRSSRVVPG